MAALRFNILISILIISSESFAQFQVIANSETEAQFISEVSKALEPESHSVVDLMREVPTGGNNSDVPPSCEPQVFEDEVLSKKRTTDEYFKILKEYFGRCQKSLSRYSLKGTRALAKFGLYEYPFLQHPQVSKIFIPLSNGTKVPALVALKQDSRPRPLVVMKCGVFCSATQTPSTRNYVMHLFDQAPFNLVILANQTGFDYLYTNSSLSLGGWAEGFEALQAGKWLKEKWEHKDRISSMHLMGMSLGGNAAVFGASYNDLYPMDDGKKVYNSVAAICPVISLRPTLEHLFDSKFVGTIFNRMARKQFVNARGYLTDVPDMLSDDKFPKKNGMPEFIGDLASTSLQRRGIASTTTNFFKNNNFWNLKNKVQTPLFVWASKDDVVVNNQLNGQVMEHDEYYGKAANVGVLNMNYGSHCAFGAAYGFEASAVVLRTFVIEHSPEFFDSYKQDQMPWNFGFKKIPDSYEHVGQSWKFTAQSEKVEVTFRLFDWRGGEGCENGPDQTQPSCVVIRKYQIPISSLKAMGARIPRNIVEAQALTREFNGKVQFLGKDRSINGTSSSDFIVRWRNLYE
ncbi:MAG: alpha/beta hydrolase family protein [Bdellovibrio sp.]